MGKLVVAVAVAFVVVILGVGIYTFWVGGDTSLTWSNRLMRLRVLAQFIALIVIMSVLYLSSHH